jgi:hypothetical protein
MAQNSRNQGISYYFCWMIEGSGSGLIPLTNGSGSGSGTTFLCTSNGEGQGAFFLGARALGNTCRRGRLLNVVVEYLYLHITVLEVDVDERKEE